MGLAQLGEALFGSGSAPSSLNTPAVGDTALTGVAQPYAAVEVYKGSSTTPIGIALADALGAWSLTLAVAVALNDIFRTATGGVIVIAPAAVVVPPVAPTLNALSFSATSFTVGAAAGTVIGAITGKTAGSTLSISPNDGRLAFNGDQSALVVGLTASSAGSANYAVIETLDGATNSPRSNPVTITVSAAAGNTLAITPASGITQDAIAGTQLATVSGSPSSLSVSPNDGRVIVAGAPGAWRLVKGLSAWATGDIPVTVTGSDGATGSTTLSVGANPTYTPRVANARQAISAAATSTNVAAEVSALAASATAKTKPLVAVAANATLTAAFKLGAAAPQGVVINAISTAAGFGYALASSTDSTTGLDGTWTEGTVPAYAVSGQPEQGRGWAGALTGALPADAWVRVQVTAGSSAGNVALGLYARPASGLMDIAAILGMSITIQASPAFIAEQAIRSIDVARDPIVLNLGVPGYMTYAASGASMAASQAPLIQAAISAGVPISHALVDPGPNDLTPRRPYTTANGDIIRANFEQLRTALVGAGIPEARQCWVDMDYVNWSTSPVVNGIANPENGSPPYNQQVVGPYYKARAFLASHHPGWDAPAGQFSAITAVHLESMFNDGTTHPNGPFYGPVTAKFAPAIRAMSGMPIGAPALEGYITSSVRGGVTTAYRKQRLLDMLGFLPPTTDPAAAAVRAQATALVNALDTNAANYADPPGVTPYSARSVPPALWFDPADLRQVTKVAGLSARVAQVVTRDANAFVIAPNSGAGIYFLENSAGGRSLVRGNTGNVSAAGVSGSDGSYNAGYLELPAGAKTLLDSNTSSLTLEWDYRDSSTGGLVAGAAYVFGSAGMSFQASAGFFPVMTLASGQRIVGSKPVRHGVMHHYALTYNQTTKVWTLLMDGEAVGTITYTKPTTTNWLLALLGNGTFRAGGDLGDTVVTQALVSGADLAAGRSYAQAKWGTP